MQFYYKANEAFGEESDAVQGDGFALHVFVFSYWTYVSVEQGVLGLALGRKRR